MKQRLATLLLTLLLGAGSVLPVTAATGQDADSFTTKLPVSELAAAEAAEARSALILDLSLIGIIGVGVIGLLWIRRHTSEL